MPGLSRNQARMYFACCQQVRERVPFLVPSSCRCLRSGARNLDHELDRDVERDAVIKHAEPSGGWDLW